MLAHTFSKPVQLKRKSLKDDSEAEYREWSANSGFAHSLNSPLQTPVSAKGNRVNNRAKASKAKKPGPQTPVSNAGERHCPFALRLIILFSRV